MIPSFFSPLDLTLPLSGWAGSKENDSGFAITKHQNDEADTLLQLENPNLVPLDRHGVAAASKMTVAFYICIRAESRNSTGR